jgi:hypothetical protein
MNLWTLKFKSLHVERQYRLEYIENHIYVMRFCVWLLCVLLFLWTLIEAIMLNVTLQYTLMRVIATVVFVGLAVYASTSSFLVNFQQVTIVLMVAIVIGKFGLEVSFQREGGLASSFVPILTFVLFNVGFCQICMVNLLHIFLFFISLGVWAAY